MADLEVIRNQIHQREPTNGIRIVGIDGPSAAGKSTLAADLSVVMEAPVIEIDDFVSWDCFSGWWPRFEEQVLSPLLAGEDAVYQARDWSDWHGHSLGDWKRQPWCPTVILEGVTCTRRETVGRIVYAAWVEAPSDVRLERGLARDAAFPDAPALWNRWMREEDEFFALDRTRERADVTISTATASPSWSGRPLRPGGETSRSSERACK